MSRHAALFTIALVATSTSALAHTTPAVLGTAGDGVVRMAHGLAVRGDDGVHRFLCPSAWGGPDRALADGRVVVGIGLVSRIDTEGFTRPVGAFDGTIRTIENHDDGPLLLVQDTGSTLYRVVGNALTVVRSWSDRFDGLAVTNANIYVAAARPDGSLRVVNLAHNGEIGGDRTVVADLSLEAISLVATPELFVRASGTSTRIGRVGGDAIEWIASSTTAIFGPISVEGRTLIVQGGELREREADGWSVIDATRRYTCLEPTVVCTRLALYDLTQGRVGDLQFELDDVVEPNFSALAEDVRIGCRAEWTDFATEAGLDLTTEPEPEPQESCSCRHTTRASGWWWTLPLLLRRKRS